MRFFALVAVSLLAPIAATPTPRDNWSVDDLKVLNYILHLEHLENAFYQDRLAKYSQNDFQAAGFPDWALSRWHQIRDHEQTHVKFLVTALEGAKADQVKPCKYKFPDYDVLSFVKTSSDLETVRTNAANGALQFTQNNDYVTVTGSILAVEARHSAWIDSAVRKKSAWGTAFDVPLTFRQTSTIFTSFIESCPSENTALLPPHATDAFPQLEIKGDLIPGQKSRVKFPGIESLAKERHEVIVKTGLGELRAPLNKDGWFLIPEDAQTRGPSFIFVVLEGKSLNDDNIVAGPVLVSFDSTSCDN